VTLPPDGYVHVCDDGSVTYEWDYQACKEAAEHQVSGADANILRGECSRKAADLDPDGVRSHAVRFPVTGWGELPGLSVALAASPGVGTGFI
jgi:hypothetical protein